MARGGVNKAILIGNLGADPEIRYTQNERAVANLRVATTRRWRDRETGEQQERTEWHRVVLFGKLGEIAGEYLRKGSQVYLEGRIQTRKWQGQDGQDRYTTEIVANQMQMLASASASAGAGDASATADSGAQYGNTPPAQGRGQSANALEDDDIPF